MYIHITHEKQQQQQKKSYLLKNISLQNEIYKSNK